MNQRLDKAFYNNFLKPNKNQRENIEQEIGRQYVDNKFNKISREFQKLLLSLDKKNLQIKSAEVDWETYEFIIKVIKEIRDICNIMKCVTGPGSDELKIFRDESNLILKKRLNGMNGIISKLEGIQHKFSEKRKDIEKKYFSNSEQDNLI